MEEETPINLEDIISDKLNIPKEFFEGLSQDSDWAFTIKIHAMIEAAVNHLLVSHLKDDRLSKIIVSMELSDQAKGRLAYIKSLELLPTEERGFIKQLSEIRNGMVHNVRTTTLDLPGFVATLSRERRNNLIDAIGGMMAESPISFSQSGTGNDFENVTGREFARENLRYAILMGAIHVTQQCLGANAHESGAWIVGLKFEPPFWPPLSIPKTQ